MKLDAETAHRIKVGQVRSLIRDASLTLGKHLIQVDRPRRPEDGYDDKRLETVTETKCQIAVSSVTRTEFLGVTNDDAKAAGYPSVHVFRDQRQELKGRRSVYVVAFDLLVEDQDPIRKLSPVGGYGSGLTVDNEAEGVHAWVQDGLTSEAKTFDELRAQKRRETWERETSLLKRYERSVLEARERSIDISHHERVIADRVDRIERQLGKDKAA